MATVKYVVDGQTLNHVGHDSLKQVYFFTKEENGSNKLIEVPYDFSGIIYSTEEELRKVFPSLIVDNPAYL